VDQAPPVWTESFRVRAYEVDATARASVPAVANWLQETAGNHATALGWAVDALQAQGRTWVLARLHLCLGGAPSWREDVHVTTWPSGVHRLYALREFRLTGSGDRELGVATTGWLLLDLAGRRPVRLPDALEEVAHRTPERVLADPFAKLPEPEGAGTVKTFEVRLSELDMNRHANNVSVIAWALEALPEEVVLSASLAELEIEFRAEALLGNLVHSHAHRVAEGSAAFLHRLVRESDGREIARARTLWRSG
jgi:medium-chain acyl-[acyl-carrier-protein] hydrolase